MSLEAPGHKTGESFEACLGLCRDDGSCLRFAWTIEECNTSSVIRFEEATQISSFAFGFMIDRLDEYTVVGRLQYGTVAR